MSSSLLILRHVLPDAESDYFTQSGWHGIADVRTNMLERDSPVLCHELVIGGKRLQRRRFTKGNCAVLIWMTESTVAKSEALGRERWRQGIPSHSAINARICLPRVPLMTFQAQGFRPILPPSPLFGSLNTTKVQRRESAGAMERVVRGRWSTC